MQVKNKNEPAVDSLDDSSEDPRSEPDTALLSDLEILKQDIQAFKKNQLKKVSSLLMPGEVYTREALKKLLVTNDATINTGIFSPAGFSSILLFITEKKTQDRTQYSDKLNGDVLHWQGQLKGRKDQRITEHEAGGEELLIFFREKKYQYAGAGFRFEGEFRYVSHSGHEPTNFLLMRSAVPGTSTPATPETQALEAAEFEAQDAGAFDPADPQDAREKTFGAIARRQGQPAFRSKLLKAYGNACAISGCSVIEILEAAHIKPYRGPQTNHVTNGILLRCDLHTLFDLRMITIDETSRQIVVSPVLADTEYGQWHGKKLRLPKNLSDHPSWAALRMHSDVDSE